MAATTGTADVQRLRVFISYARENGAHDASVCLFADGLWRLGLEAVIDQYVVAPPDGGWLSWMRASVEEADAFVLVCTPTYLQRFSQRDLKGTYGVAWEARLLDTRNARDRGAKVFLLVPPETARGTLPAPYATEGHVVPWSDANPGNLAVEALYDLASKLGRDVTASAPPTRGEGWTALARARVEARLARGHAVLKEHAISTFARVLQGDLDADGFPTLIPRTVTVLLQEGRPESLGDRVAEPGLSLLVADQGEGKSRQLALLARDTLAEDRAVLMVEAAAILRQGEIAAVLREQGLPAGDCAAAAEALLAAEPCPLLLVDALDEASDVTAATEAVLEVLRRHPHGAALITQRTASFYTRVQPRGCIVLQFTPWTRADVAAQVARFGLARNVEASQEQLAGDVVSPFLLGLLRDDAEAEDLRPGPLLVRAIDHALAGKGVSARDAVPAARRASLPFGPARAALRDLAWRLVRGSDGAPSALTDLDGLEELARSAQGPALETLVVAAGVLEWREDRHVRFRHTLYRDVLVAERLRDQLRALDKASLPGAVEPVGATVRHGRWTGDLVGLLVALAFIVFGTMCLGALGLWIVEEPGMICPAIMPALIVVAVVLVGAEVASNVAGEALARARWLRRRRELGDWKQMAPQDAASVLALTRDLVAPEVGTRLFQYAVDDDDAAAMAAVMLAADPLSPEELTIFGEADAARRLVQQATAESAALLLRIARRVGTIRSLFEGWEQIDEIRTRRPEVAPQLVVMVDALVASMRALAATPGAMGTQREALKALQSMGAPGAEVMELFRPAREAVLERLARDAVATNDRLLSMPLRQEDVAPLLAADVLGPGGHVLLEAAEAGWVAEWLGAALPSVGDLETIDLGATGVWTRETKMVRWTTRVRRGTGMYRLDLDGYPGEELMEDVEEHHERVEPVALTTHGPLPVPQGRHAVRLLWERLPGRGAS